MNERLEQLLKSIKTLEDEKKLVENKIKNERQELFNVLEEEKIAQYKSDTATVAYMERKIVKYEDREAVLNKLVENNLPKYFDVIPETKQINKTFETDVKNGAYKLEGVTVDIKKLLQIRFKQ